MSLEAARAHFADVVTTAWAARYPSVPIEYENRKFDQPVPSPWMDFNIMETDRKRKNIGVSRFVRSMGMLVLELYVPEDSGTRELFEMGDYIGTALEEQNHPLGNSMNATTFTAKKRSDGKVNGFYRLTVIVEYWFDECFDS